MDGGHKVDLDAANGLIGSDGGFHAAGLRSGFNKAEELGFFLGKERACACNQEEKSENLKALADGKLHNCLIASRICVGRFILTIAGQSASLDFATEAATEAFAKTIRMSSARKNPLERGK